MDCCRRISVNKIRHAGFTMIEIMVVIMLIGMFTTFVVPRFFKRPLAIEWTAITDDLNALVSFARQEAIANQKNYRLAFCKQLKGPCSVSVLKEDKDPEDAKKIIYIPVESLYFNARYEFAPSVTCENFYYNKREQFEENKGFGFCHVTSDGLVQDVLIHLLRVYEGRESRASIKILPFVGKFELFDTHIKPEK